MLPKRLNLPWSYCATIFRTRITWRSDRSAEAGASAVLIPKGEGASHGTVVKTAQVQR